MNVFWKNGQETALRLVVFTAAGVCYGADAEQIAAICDYTPDAATGDVVMLAERLVYRRQAMNASPATILEVKGDKRLCRVAVDRVEELIDIDIDVIRPLPTLVRPYTVGIGIWGVVSRSDKMLLLLDFTRLPACGNEGGNDDERLHQYEAGKESC